jgi:hypothetical protein
MTGHALALGVRHGRVKGRGVPTLLRWRGWTFLFYSADWREPPHVHARKGRQEVKFWLRDCSVAVVRRVPQHELSVLQQQVRRHQATFLEKWHAHFGGGA